MSQLWNLYQQAGADAFTQMLCQFAPYFSTITPKFITLG